MKIGIVTLGCDKNTADAEYIAGRLERNGDIKTIRGDIGDLSLDAVLIITCGFIEAAQEESLHSIMDWIDSAEKRPEHFVIAVTGCLSQVNAEELRKELPRIDLITGVGEFVDLAETLTRLCEEKRSGRKETSLINIAHVAKTPNAVIDTVTPRVALDDSATAYLKISDGCDYACAFCSIPLMKGPYRSVAREIVIEEARALIKRGAKELVLVGQDVSAYGIDLNPSLRLPDLLRDICRIPGDFWIRVMYFYPGGFCDELIDTMSSETKICEYLDIPLQHIDPAICKAMRRPYSDVKVWEWIERLRAAIPDVALRSTFIVGFPGEGKKEFMRLLNGLGKIKFDNAGFFPFSPREGTAAIEMPKQVNEKTKITRIERLVRRQIKIAEEVNQRFIGREIEVLVDGRFPDTDIYIGHARSQAFEADGMTRFVSSRELETGKFTRVEINAVEGFDLIGETHSN